MALRSMAATLDYSSVQPAKDRGLLEEVILKVLQLPIAIQLVMLRHRKRFGLVFTARIRLAIQG